MKPLTEVQQRALNQLKKNGPSSAYKVGFSLTTLNALCAKGYATKRMGLGSMAFPRSSIIFTAKDQGE